MMFDFYQDPAHGWIKVKISLLEKLGVADKISGYSYMKGQYAYLEEDSDASVFIMALKASGKMFFVREHTSDKSSKIRSYEPYKRR